jgi:hypothetical protein
MKTNREALPGSIPLNDLTVRNERVITISV